VNEEIDEQGMPLSWLSAVAITPSLADLKSIVLAGWS
jgi:hypothetical protein